MGIDDPPPPPPPEPPDDVAETDQSAADNAAYASEIEGDALDQGVPPADAGDRLEAHFDRAADSLTQPSGEIGDRPHGDPKEIHPNAGPDEARAIRRENESAEIVAAHGYRIEQLPELSNQKNPDYLIEERVFDCTAPTTDKPENITMTLDDKAFAGQADRFVVNLNDSTVTPEQLRENLNAYPVEERREVFAIKGEDSSRVYPQDED